MLILSAVHHSNMSDLCLIGPDLMRLRVCFPSHCPNEFKRELRCGIETVLLYGSHSLNIREETRKSLEDAEKLSL